MRVLGIDPGLRNMGWGIIDVRGSKLTHIANGICKSQGEDLAARLLCLFEQMEQILQTWSPTQAAVENTFVNKDGVNSLKLAHARAIALLVPRKFGLPVSEYAPNKVKKTVVGIGHADKQQIAHMVKLQLPGVKLNGPDSSDALAIAICHSYHAVSNNRFQQALEKV
jgi:crossover junction endodeoxyribonuclease RuvC|tara:strand:+ start:8965 stop:9465 length:501 start_codon:yes stop_codon:yes gene_type:complete